MSPATLEEALGSVRERIADAAGRAGRPAGAARIVAVTKTHPADAVVAAADAGLTDVGESRAPELLDKERALGERPGGRPPVDWHFVGRVQRNKVPKLAPLVSVWHSVDRLEVGRAIARRAPGARVHVQVNTGGEPQKGGCAPRAVPALVDELRTLELDVEGLMTVPPADRDPRPHFAALRELAGGVELPELSMGMSGDFEVAVEEGATVVRLGTALFGSRVTADDRPRTRPAGADRGEPRSARPAPGE